MMIYYLHSVGTALDPDSLLTFPILVDGRVERYWGTETHLEDCCDEWWEALSRKDCALIRAATGAATADHLTQGAGK